MSLHNIRSNIWNEVRPIFYFTHASITASAALILLLRAYSMQYYMMLKRGLGPQMTPWEHSLANFYEASDPLIKPAVVVSWLVFVAGSFFHILGKSIKYAHGIVKGLDGKGSRYQKRRQGAWRLAGIAAGLVTAFAIGYTQWGFFADLLAPIVIGSGAGAAIAGSILGAIVAARFVLGIIKWIQRTYSKSTTGRSYTELKNASDAQLKQFAKDYGVEEHFVQRYVKTKWVRAWHLHWVSGNTNVTLGYQTRIKQHDAANNEIQTPYGFMRNHDYIFMMLGVGLGLLFASALIASPLTIPLTAPVIYFSATMFGFSLGRFWGGMFTKYSGMTNSNTSAWILFTVSAGALITFSIFSFGAPLALVAVSAAAFGVVALGFTIKAMVEEYNKESKRQRFQTIDTNDKLMYQNANPLQEKEERSVDNKKRFLAANHKLGHDTYLKNTAKLRRLSLFKEALKEMACGYTQSWKDTRDFLKTIEWWDEHPITRGVVQTVVAGLYGTARVIISTTWTILPIGRIYDYTRRAYKDVEMSNSTGEKVAKSIGYVIGAIPMLINPLHGTRYAYKKEHYERKRKDAKEAMRNAEEAYLLMRDKVGQMPERAQDLYQSVKTYSEEKIKGYEDKIKSLDKGHSMVNLLFYLGVRSKTTVDYSNKKERLEQRKRLYRPARP